MSRVVETGKSHQGTLSYMAQPLLECHAYAQQVRQASSGLPVCTSIFTGDLSSPPMFVVCSSNALSMDDVTILFNNTSLYISD